MRFDRERQPKPPRRIENIVRQHRGDFERPDGRMDRRQFLKSAGSVVVAALGAEAFDTFKGYTTLGKFFNDTLLGQYDYDEVVTEAKRYFSEKYGATLMVGSDEQSNSNADVRATPVELDRYKRAIQVLMQEFAAYKSPETLRAIGESSGFEVRIAKQVKWRKKGSEREYDEAAGLTLGLELGKPAVAYVDAGQAESSWPGIIHHELTHGLSARWEIPAERNDQWIKMHAALGGYPYRFRPDGTMGQKTASLELKECFLTDYARESPAEDQAVCAEYLMVPELHVEFLRKIQNTKFPRAKRILVEKYLVTKENFKQWSGGKMDDAYWDAIITEGLKGREKDAKRVSESFGSLESK